MFGHVSERVCFVMLLEESLFHFVLFGRFIHSNLGESAFFNEKIQRFVSLFEEKAYICRLKTNEKK